MGRCHAGRVLPIPPASGVALIPDRHRPPEPGTGACASPQRHNPAARGGAPRSILQVVPTGPDLPAALDLAAATALALEEAARAQGLPLSLRQLVLDVPHPAAGAAAPAAQPLIAQLRQADAIYIHHAASEAGLFVAAHARMLGRPAFGLDHGGPGAALLRHDPDALILYQALHAPGACAAAALEGQPLPVLTLAAPVDTRRNLPPPAGAPPRDPRLLLGLAPLLPQHGQDRLIRALPPGLSLCLAGPQPDAEYLGFLRRCAEGRPVRFTPMADEAALRPLLHQAGLGLQASAHTDHRGHFHHQPELLARAPLQALACGLPVLVSASGALAELDGLPGCRLFRSPEELRDLLRAVAEDGLAFPPAEALHRGVEARHGPAATGPRLLALLTGAMPCAS